MKILVKSLKPNPFRNIERYPISRDKVDALKRSIKDTTFWDNLLVREAPDGKGYEITFGHHRKIALEELIKEKKIVASIEAQVRDLTDTQMARMMAHENMQEWESSATVEQETIRAIVEGYANGKIELERPHGINAQHVRYAPTFGLNSEHCARKDRPYTIETLATFLGWGESKVEAALTGLAAVEEDVADDEDFKGLSSTQAKVIAQQGRRLAKHKGKPKAKEIVKELAKDIRAGHLSTHGVKFAADTKSGMRDDTWLNLQKTPRKIPDINEFANGIASNIDALFFARKDEFDAIIEHQAMLSRSSRAVLLAALKRAVDVYESLNVVPMPKSGQKLIA